jgi:hypothetical protein
MQSNHNSRTNCPQQLKEKQMKTSEVFKQAKQHLWDGDYDVYAQRDVEIYICHAIEEVAFRKSMYDVNSRRYAPYTRAKRIIHQRIAPHYDLENWVRANVKGSHKVLNKAGGAKQLQAFRQRWLDALIQEFESLGE